MSVPTANCSEIDCKYGIEFIDDNGGGSECGYECCDFCLCDGHDDESAIRARRLDRSDIIGRPEEMNVPGFDFHPLRGSKPHAIQPM